MSLFNLIKLLSVVKRKKPYLNGTKEFSTETWNRLYILWFLTLWLLGGMNHVPVRNDLTWSLLWLELQNWKGKQCMQNIGFESCLFVCFKYIYINPTSIQFSLSFVLEQFISIYQQPGAIAWWELLDWPTISKCQCMSKEQHIEVGKCTEKCCANLHQLCWGI